MPVVYDPKTGEYEYQTEESPAPPNELDIGELAQFWLSHSPEHRTEMPQEQDYDKVIGDNRIHTAESRKMVFTKRKWVREFPGRPWGDVCKHADSDVNLPAGETTPLASWKGYGWLHSAYWVVDSPLVELVLLRDSPGIFRNISAEDLFKDWGHTNMDAALECTKYDTKNSRYVITFDPGSYPYYNGNMIVQIDNPDGSDHTLIEYETRAMNNPLE